MIDRFEGSFRWLSNFYPCDVPYEDMIYPSAEHAFVAAKTLNQELRIKIQDIETPGWAKAFGRKLVLREDWESIRINEMRKIVTAKFNYNPWLMNKLLDTAPHELIEGNYWNDRFWGKDLAGYGENNLGKILMEIRNVRLAET